MSMRRTLTRDLHRGARIVAHVELREDDTTLSDGFSVTGEVYEPRSNAHGAARQRLGREPDVCGAIHDELGRAFPNLRPVIALHLSDPEGVPMHAEANGRYWHEQATGRAPISETYGRENDRGETRSAYCRRLACETLRVRQIPADLDALPTAVYRVAFAAFVDEQRERWRSEADACRALIAALPEEDS